MVFAGDFWYSGFFAPSFWPTSPAIHKWDFCFADFGSGAKLFKLSFWGVYYGLT